METDQQLIHLVKELLVKRKTYHVEHVVIEAEQNLPLSDKRREQLNFILTASPRMMSNAAFLGEDIYYPVSTRYRNYRLNAQNTRKCQYKNTTES